MSRRPIHSNSPEVLHIMQVLGLPPNVSKFTLYVEHGELAVVEVSYYPEKPKNEPRFDLVTKRFQLVEVPSATSITA